MPHAFAFFHRENSYIEYVLGSSPNQRCEADPSEVLNEIDLTLRGMGRIKTSKTFPSLCRATMDTAIACLETVAKVTLLPSQCLSAGHCKFLPTLTSIFGPLLGYHQEKLFLAPFLKWDK